MAYSKVAIANLALATLGADAIRSFDEKNKRARMSSNFFDSTRDYLLAKFDWPFARGFKKLNEVDMMDIDVPAGMKVYQLPNDCRTPRDLWPPGSKTPWRIAADRLYTPTTGTIYLYYTVQEVNTALFTDTFVSLLALGMAVRMAPAITQDKNLSKILYEQYQTEQLESWESDANIGEDYRSPDEDPNNDTFVYPDGYWHDPKNPYSRFMDPE